MTSFTGSQGRRLRGLSAGPASLVLVWLLTACTAATPQASPSAAPVPAGAAQPSGLRDVPAIGALPGGAAPAAAPAAPSSGAAPAPAAAPAPPAAPLKLLKVQPSSGNVGDPFTVTGEGLPPGKAVDFAWLTVDGSYDTKVGPENVEFYEKKFVEKRFSLGRATTDAEGRVTASLKAPEDHGEVHDFYAVVDGQDIAKGGYRITRNITISPQEGPVGTPITIKVTGLGWKTYESTIGVRYNNLPTGIVSSVTTSGTAVVQIRAAGPPGKHVIDFNHAARSNPYLNNWQSGTAHIPDIRLWFTVTADVGAPPFTLNWPDASRLAKAGDIALRTTAGGGAAPAAAATIEPASGPILSRATIRAKGLAAGSETELVWVTVKGNRTVLSGWGTTDSVLQKATVGADGSLAATFQVPDDLGGWHTVKLMQGDKVLGEAPYYVERSIVDVSPRVMKQGEVFEVKMKGAGWTELDNGFAATYDNGYIGFACGFNSQGDITMPLVATGGPGTHIIDLYPMIYQGHGKPPWSYQWPILSYAQDAPGLALGYRLPAFRLAITIVE